MTIEITANPQTASEGTIVLLQAAEPDARASYQYVWDTRGQGRIIRQEEREADWDTTGLRSRGYKITVTATKTHGDSEARQEDSGEVVVVVEPRPVSREDTQPVTLRRTAIQVPRDAALWVVIQRSAEDLSFDNYDRFIKHVLCNGPAPDGSNEAATTFSRLKEKKFLPYNDVDAYRLLKIASEAFVMVNCAVNLYDPSAPRPYPFTEEDTDKLRQLGSDGRSFDIDHLWEDYLVQVNGTSDKTLPYLALIRRKLEDERLKQLLFGERRDNQEGDRCIGILIDKLTNPCLLELIWSYWLEEGMLVQTLNAISRRFQNIRSSRQRDPLANLEIDPLRALNNLLWGYLQDEQHRLSVKRRAFEYDHHYGISLQGKAVPVLQTADSRSKFLESFHNLLYLCTIFFQQEDDTTVLSDGFPILNALQEVHRILAEGAHNQFGDLPSTARQEMLIQQWLLARPEFREFLPTRVMVAYDEPWMDRVDAMKALQGWTDVSIADFHHLAVFGEQLLLSIRFGSWSEVNEPDQAAFWARFWRAAIQRYIHSYRVATGVDLTADVSEGRQQQDRYTQPSVLLRRRLPTKATAR